MDSSSTYLPLTGSVAYHETSNKLSASQIVDHTNSYPCFCDTVPPLELGEWSWEYSAGDPGVSKRRKHVVKQCVWSRGPSLQLVRSTTALLHRVPLLECHREVVSTGPLLGQQAKRRLPFSDSLTVWAFWPMRASQKCRGMCTLFLRCPGRCGEWLTANS